MMPVSRRSASMYSVAPASPLVSRARAWARTTGSVCPRAQPSRLRVQGRRGWTIGRGDRRLFVPENCERWTGNPPTRPSYWYMTDWLTVVNTLVSLIASRGVAIAGQSPADRRAGRREREARREDCRISSFAAQREALMRVQDIASIISGELSAKYSRQDETGEHFTPETPTGSAKSDRR